MYGLLFPWSPVVDLSEDEDSYVMAYGIQEQPLSSFHSHKDKADERLRKAFIDLRNEMNSKGTHTDMRFIVDLKLKASIHDRWIMADNACFNLPSPDAIARGQYSEVKKTELRPPFEEWWTRSLDIVEAWDRI